MPEACVEKAWAVMSSSGTRIKRAEGNSSAKLQRLCGHGNVAGRPVWAESQDWLKAGARKFPRTEGCRKSRKDRVPLKTAPSTLTEAA